MISIGHITELLNLEDLQVEEVYDFPVTQQSVRLHSGGLYSNYCETPLSTFRKQQVMTPSELWLPQVKQRTEQHKRISMTRMSIAEKCVK